MSTPIFDWTNMKREITIPATESDWTIMVYIVADGTLANFAVDSLKKLNESVHPRAPASVSTPGTRSPSVVVAAQFSYDSPGGQIKDRYAFNGHGDVDDLSKSKVAELRVSARMAATTPEKEALIDFLGWAYENCKAKHYALVLWGHGPELLLQPPSPGNSGPDRRNLYLNPEELREALEKGVPLNLNTNKRALDIVGFDACFMSMFEMAYELRDVAAYMVASQEEVPDLSFPYDTLIGLFRQHSSNTPLLLKEGVKMYVDNYKNCVCNATTGMKPVTLSALILENCERLKIAVCNLACALLKAKAEPGLADLLINARLSSQDYASGLYVDLVDFCTNLTGQLDGRANVGLENKTAIQKACREAQGALTYLKSDAAHLERDGDKSATDHEQKGLILAKSSHTDTKGPEVNFDNKRSNGISIYLPYLTDQQYAQVSTPLVKGGMLTGFKGYSDMLNGAATEYLMCARRGLILDTESYYEGLQMASATHWYDFITEVWTKVLIKTAAAELDFHYSAQQAWINGFRKAPAIAEPCEVAQGAQTEQLEAV